MKKIGLFLMLTATALLTVVSCHKDPDQPDKPDQPDQPDVPAETAPELTLKVTDVTADSAVLNLVTDNGEEYAYALFTGKVDTPDAAALFTDGTSSSFDGKTEAKTTLKDLKISMDYQVFAAARTKTQDGYLYSETASAGFRTEGYEEVITLLDKGYTSYSYHIEVPKGKTYKHISARKVDFDWIAAMIGADENSYVSAFGYTIDASGDFEYDKYFEDIYEGPVNIYPDDTYIIIAAEVDEYGQGISSTVSHIIVKTDKMKESPYTVKVSATDLLSTTATVTMTPEKGIEKYRWNIQKKEDFDYVAKEGEASVRSLIIGDWPNTENEADGEKTVKLSGLYPNTDYIVGVIGFDAEEGMKQEMYEFTTGEPTGPSPEIEFTELEVDVPSTTAAYILKIRHAITANLDIHTKAQYDEVLSRPDVTLDMVVKNNGIPLTADQLNSALGEDGLKCMFDQLQADTEYVLGVYAENDEYTSAVDTVRFRTAKLPDAGGDVKAKMPGKYTATMLNSDGQELVFPVEIATGVNDATTEEYAAKNRLVCLGFGMAEYQAVTPEELMAQGMSEADANFNYGPKWFIEFQPDGTITTPQVVDYDFDFDMYNCNGSRIRFCGYAKRATGTLTDMQCAFPIEVSEDGNTITIKPYVTTSEWSGETFTYYPGAMLMSSQWSGDPIIAGGSEMVLVRETQQADAYYSPDAFNRRWSIPEIIELDLSTVDGREEWILGKSRAAEFIR